MKRIWQLLKDWIKPGEAFSVRGTLFGRLCLFTNLRRLIGHRYALRWWQEERFKDLKSGGWR